MPFMDNLYENNVGLSFRENINKKGGGRNREVTFRVCPSPLKSKWKSSQEKISESI